MLLIATIWVVTDIDAQRVKKLFVAERIYNPPVIDGYLSENVWSKVKADSINYQFLPSNGSKPTEITEFKILYDDKAIYVGAFMYDTRPDSLLKGLGKRDDGFNMNAEQFFIDIGTYNDGINSFTFMVSSSGVQTDYKNFYEKQDKTWNAVWKSQVRLTSVGWFVEMKIPYSAIRLTKKLLQVWSLNVFRLIKRREEIDCWNFVDRNIKGTVNQAGQLIGIKNIKPPFRLSLTPIVTNYLIKEKNTENLKYDLRAGIDLKYGINPSFTVDASITPDYEQVPYDDLVLNISPFEQKYEERRQFFSEGSEMFESADIYYSRRIGLTPRGYYSVEDSLQNKEIIQNNPVHTKIGNAIKLTGRTARQYGIGILNAFSLPSYAILFDTVSKISREVLTQDYSNYNIISIDKTLTNNSFISLINTNLAEKNRSYLANVSGTEFKFSDKNNAYAISGLVAYSYINHKDSVVRTGFKSKIFIDKTSGKFQFRLANEIISTDYNQNDIGYLPFKNEISSYADVMYNIFTPFGKVLSWENVLGLKYSSLYEPKLFTDFQLNMASKILFSNQFSTDVLAYWRPIGNHDYYEARETKAFKKAPSYYGEINTRSDSRKIFSLAVSYQYWGSTSSINLEMNSFKVTPWLRIHNRTQFGVDFYNYQFKNSIGFVNKVVDTIYMGKRDIFNAAVTINFLYTFTNRAWLNFKLRHYRSKVAYDLFYRLKDNGKLEIVDNYNLPADIDYHIFTIDFAMKWEFAPGSLISLIWKDILESSYSTVSGNYFNDFTSIFTEPHGSSLSLRFVYYFDFLYLKRTHGNRKN